MNDENRHLTLKDMVNWAVVTNTLNSIEFDFSKCRLVCAKDSIAERDSWEKEWDEICSSLKPHIKKLKNMKIVESQK